MAARTYSIRASANVFERTSRLSWAQPRTVMTPITKAMKTLLGAVTGIRDVNAR
jgi:hypothetical protein